MKSGQELERSSPLARAARAVQLAWRFICSAVPRADLKDRIFKTYNGNQSAHGSETLKDDQRPFDIYLST